MKTFWEWLEFDLMEAEITDFFGVEYRVQSVLYSLPPGEIHNKAMAIYNTYRRGDVHALLVLSDLLEEEGEQEVADYIRSNIKKVKSKYNIGDKVVYWDDEAADGGPVGRGKIIALYSGGCYDDESPRVVYQIHDERPVRVLGGWSSRTIIRDERDVYTPSPETDPLRRGT